MEKKKIKQITAEQIIEVLGVTENMAHKYLRGANKPSYENMIKLNKKLKIPFYAWQDFKAYQNGDLKS